MVKRPEKLRRQMVSRGWTDAQIAEAVAGGARVAAANRETDRPATRYIHPETGRSVVIEDESGEVIMSAAMASSTDWTDVHVRIVDDAVDVWRPVKARAVSDHVFHLSDDPVPTDERWAFEPGDGVVVERRANGDADVLVAVARASDMDERSNLWLRKAG